MIMVVLWPEVFITGRLEEKDERVIIADALMAWVMCTFSKPPQNFGIGMAAVGSRLDIPAIPESLSQYAKEKGYL